MHLTAHEMGVACVLCALLPLATTATTTTTTIRAGVWSPPTSLSLQAAEQRCQPLATASAKRQCVYGELGLWSEAGGYSARRLAKMLQRRHASHYDAVELVVNHCNRQAALLQSWAAYRCATARSLGVWLENHFDALRLEGANSE